MTTNGFLLAVTPISHFYLISQRNTPLVAIVNLRISLEAITHLLSST
jgi:hypothetical protein